jgi:AcrR family transcriptional regulator
MTTKSLRDKMLDTALALAQRRSWEAVRLHDVAAALGLSLDDVRTHFREKEGLVDAWFDRADAVMLQDAAEPDCVALASVARLHRLIMAWLGALGAHKRVTRQMILGKLEPGHLHTQIAGLLRVSRTVQWLREAAHRDAVLPWRAFEETALTGIYLTAFGYWLQDESEGASRTAALLKRLLGAADRVSNLVQGGAGGPRRSARAAPPSPSPEKGAGGPAHRH